MLLAFVGALSGCGGDPAPSVAAEPPLDTSPGERPSDALAEIELDAEASLERLRALLADEALRALVPARVVDLVEATTPLPGALRRRLRPERGARALVFSPEVDAEPGEAELVWAFAIEPLPAAAASAGAEDETLATEPGAPRGARWVVGEPVAIAGDVAIAGSSRARVEAALAYLAFTAMPRAASSGRVVLTATRELVVSALRPIADAALGRWARDARASAEAAMRAHAEPPALGAPDRFVERVRARAAEWIAYLPDLSDVRVELAAQDGGLRVSIDAVVADGSPLAGLLAESPPGELGGIAALPEGTALALALRSSPEARRTRTERWLADLADVAGERLGAGERVELGATAAGWDAALGQTSLWALGRTEAGLFALVAGPDAAPAPPDDPALRPFWGARSRPYTSLLVAGVAGCEPDEPRGEAPLVICEGARFDAGRGAAGGLVAAIAPEDAGALAEATLAALGGSRAAFAASPDVARALAPHAAAPGHFALALVPSRVLGLLAAAERMRAPSAAPPAALVLSGRPGEPGHVVLSLTADAAAVADSVSLFHALSR